MTTGGLTQGRILRLWAPLEAAWLLMAVEGPFLAAILARMPEATLNLGAYGVACGLAWMFESPIILIMSAATALVENRHSLRKMRAFTYALNGTVTLGLAIFVLPPVFYLVTETVMGLPPAVTRLAHPACVLLLPWPSAIGYRRFYQGILMRSGLTRRIAYGTALRLSTMGAVAVLLATLTRLPGALVGTAALSTGVVMEAVASRFWAREPVRRLLDTPSSPSYQQAPLSYRGIAQFYLPLALTSILAVGVNPLVAFFLGRSRMPLESLAVMPVVNGMIFAFNTAGLTFQEVAIPLYALDRNNFKALKRFAGWLALITSGALALMVSTPLLGLWLERVAGLAPALARFAWLPVALITLLPAITAATCFQRALLVVVRTTRPITWASGVEVAGIAGTLFALTQLCGWVGAVAAVCAMVTGRLAAMLYLLPRTGRALRAAAAIIPEGTAPA
jgi:hypothetical protein